MHCDADPTFRSCPARSSGVSLTVRKFLSFVPIMAAAAPSNTIDHRPGHGTFAPWPGLGTALTR
jgi:hypothetical protein